MTKSTNTHEWASLVRAFRAGDVDAFTRLYHQFEPQVMQQALRCSRDAHEARDLCQDVFTTAFTKIGQLRADESFGGWLRTITLRLAINRTQRRRAVQLVDQQCLEDQSVESRTPEQTVMANERRDQVRSRLNGLRDLDRQALSAFYMEGQSLRQMSARFDAKVGTIKRRLFDARQRLAAEMAEFVNA